MTRDELSTWLNQCSRYQTPQESRVAAQHRCRGPGAYRKAMVTVNLETIQMEVSVPVHESNVDRGRLDMLDSISWPQVFPDRFRTTGRIWEVLKPFGQHGFLTRLVVRGYSPVRQNPFTDIFSLNFLIPYRAPRVLHVPESEPGGQCYFEPVQVDDWQLAARPEFQSYAKCLTPNRLSELIEKMGGCTINASGTVVGVAGIFRRGQFHAVSSTETRREVIDV